MQMRQKKWIRRIHLCDRIQFTSGTTALMNGIYIGATNTVKIREIVALMAVIDGGQF